MIAGIDEGVDGKETMEEEAGREARAASDGSRGISSVAPSSSFPDWRVGRTAFVRKDALW